MNLLRKVFFAAIVAFSGNSASAEDAWRGGEFRTSVILTITGNVALPSRGASDYKTDKFFEFNEISFENAAQFDSAVLMALPQTSVSADFPKGEDVVTFQGPMLSDVLHAAGATGSTITVRALDGYAVEVPVEEVIAKGAVLALKRDGIPFGIGDFGPTQLVFPRAERDELSDMNDDWWVWSIYHIHIE